MIGPVPEPFPFHYLLENIPPRLAEGFQKRSFNWDRKYSRPIFSFVRYCPPLAEAEALRDNFPEFVLFQPNTPFGGRLAIAAEPRDFFCVLDFLERSDSPELFQVVNSELSPSGERLFILGGVKSSGPRVMGILNITPDSFYDGGKYYKLTDYEATAARLIEDGCDIIDIGGESTRPGSQPVNLEEELRRVLPAIRQIRSRFRIPISIDTTKPEVADQALAAGADLVNDTSGLAAGKKMVEAVCKHDASYCLMHTGGEPSTMQDNPDYREVIAEVYCFFKKKMEFCENLGLKKDRILLDPGIGFGKSLQHNFDLLRFLSAFNNLGSQILIGTSRKSFIGKILNNNPDERLYGTIPTIVLALKSGARYLRTHDVKAVSDVVRITNRYENDEN